MKNTQYRFCWALFILPMLLMIPPSQSFPGGVGEIANNGCLCHGPSQEITEVQLQGLPEKFESNTSYQLTFSITSEIVIQPNTSTMGGFRILVSQGEIQFENDNHSQLVEDGWSHTAEGNQYRIWNFTWTSPSDNTSSVDFKIFGNAVNGNNDPYGDAWNYQSIRIGGVDYFEELTAKNLGQEIEGYEKLILGAVSISLICLAYRAIK